MSRTKRVILTAIKGHPTYAESGPSDAGQIVTDQFGQCKCLRCKLARKLGVGFDECMDQRHEAYKQVAAELAERDRQWWENERRLHPEWDEVPF